jgi:hypothetical protein
VISVGRKKSDAYLAKKAARRQAREEARRRELQKIEQAPKEHPRWIRVAKWIVGTVIVGSLGLVASVYQIWGGPPWPTAPAFAPGAPSFGSALDVPFIVTNKSVLFPIKKLHILCSANRIVVGPPNWQVRGISFSIPGFADLAPGQSRPYTCAFNSVVRGPNGDKMGVLGAAITFNSEYDSSWWSGSRTKAESEMFTLETKTSPPQWVTGEPL